MRCEEVAEHLSDLTEGTLPRAVEEAALEHLASCASCERVLADTKEAIGLVAEHGRVGLDDEARTRLLGAVLDELSPGRRRRPGPATGHR